MENLFVTWGQTDDQTVNVFSFLPMSVFFGYSKSKPCEVKLIHFTHHLVTLRFEPTQAVLGDKQAVSLPVLETGISEITT